ncbi:MAG: response regulator [Oscillospiraceae bacterium]|jgi:signal transduction histidine kinase|nr:response regulator [Oscillospiraceae bacterium]
MKRKFFDNVGMGLFLISLLLVLFLSIFVAAMMGSISDYMDEDIVQRLLAVSRHLASQIEPEEVAELRVPGDMDKPLYGELKQRLVDFADENEVLYAYYYIPAGEDGSMFQPVVDNDETDEAYTLESAPLETESAPASAFKGKAAASEFSFYSEGFGGLLSAFAPIYSRDGDVVAVAGVDITDEQIIAVRRFLRILSAALVACVAVVAVSGLFNIFLHIRRERQLRAALNDAMEAGRAKGDFLSQMSHEMRTPMNVILGVATLLKDSNDIEAYGDGLKKIESAAAHLLGVINDILDISKIESGKMTLFEEPFDFRGMVDDVKTIIDFTAGNKKQILSVDIDRELPDCLIGDRQRLGQVVTNLLSNAVKFTPEGGSITLAVRLEHAATGEEGAADEDEAAIRVSVKDDGIGITQEQMLRLFRPFEQADKSTSRRFGGAGLGLAISKRIIETMGGAIWAESEPGEGSEFIFTVTLKRGSPPDGGAGGENSPEPRDFTGHRILIAEDIEINREILYALLEPTGLEMEFAENGAVAIEKFVAANGGYDAIFMDIQMPEMDGYAATRGIRALDLPNAGTTPIIAMTANVFKEDIDRVLAAGMNGHLGKPVIIEDIMRTLAKYLT